MIYNLNKNKSNPVENYHRKLAERKYARDKSLKTRDEEINAESDYIQNTPEFESYTPAYDVNQNITQNVAEKTEEETNKGGFWGGLGYAIEQLGLGLVRSLEGISDYVVGGVAELFGQDEWADEQMRNDWINYDHANEWYNPDGVMQFVGDVASGVGGMLPSIGAAAIPGIGPALSTGMFMTSAAGQSVSDAAKQNEGLSGNEWLYGTGSGLVEGLVEKMSGGTGKLLGKATGKMFGKQIAKSTAGKLAANFVGEGLEEVASDIIDPALRGITGVNSWEEVKRQYGDLPEQLPHTFLVGGTVGSVLGSADRAGRAIQAKGFNNLNAIENASEFKRVEGQNAQAAVKGGKVLDNTALHEKLSDNLRKMDSAQRSEFISRNGLENYFNADGGIKSASENSIVSQGYNAQAYSENIANIDKDKLKYKPTANAIRPDIAQAVKDVTLLSDGNGQYVITDGLSDGVNGFYDRESGITYLSGKADAGDVRSYVASHELVHTLEGSRQYERFANTVLKEINSSEALKNKYNIDRYIQNYSAAHDGVAPETLQYIVQTEIVADFAAKEMLTDEAVLRRLINRDRNIVQRILEWVRDKIKILVSKGGDRSNIAFYKKAERQLAKALDNPTGGVSITAMDNAFKAKETSRKTAAENALAVETGIRFSQKISEYPYSMQTVISEYIESVDKKILDMVEVPKSIFERYTFSEISPEAVVKLKELTGIDFTGYKNCINSDSIKHIKDRHGKAGKADDSLSNSKDIARLPYIVENFDTIELLKNRDGKLLYSSLFYNRYNKKMPLVVFKKKINGTYYCVEAVGDNSYKKLWVVSAYINKKGLTHASDTANAAPEFTSENAHISRPFDSIIRERAEKSTEKSKNIEKNSETKSNEVGEEARYSIVNINGGRKAVLIKDNILDGVSKKDRLKTVYDTMKKFSNGIPIAGGRLIKVNAITRNEYINSKNAQYLKGNITKNTIFIDKMKASGHLDEIVLASDSYVNEGLKHTRNDNIKEFARGNVLLDIAGNQYAANVIVGFTGSNMILYDVVDFKPTKFTVTEQNGKKIDAAEGANPFERATPSTTSIREKTEKSTEKSKNIEKSIVNEKNAGEERFSIAQTDDGKRIVVIDTDQDIFDGVEAKDYPKTVRRYMLDKFHGKVFPVGTSSAYVNRRSVEEYAYSANRRQYQGTRAQKMRAGTELDNLLKVGEYIRHEADDGRHPDATRGWDYYKTWFTFDGENIYEGIISIKLIDRGDLFYDITKIENTSAARAAGIAKGNSSASDKGASTNNIRQENEKVNSLREKGVDERNSLKNEITTYGNGMSVIQKPGKYSEVLTKVKIDKLSYGEMAKDAWTNFQINFSDAQTGIVKAGKKLGIEDIDAKTNYVRAAYNAANSMLDENQADISGKRVGDGLKKIFSPVYKKGEEYVKEFYTYLLLKHHADRIKVDKTVLGDLTAAEALQLAVQREIKYPEFKTLAAKVWKYNDNLLQYRVDTGLITAEAAAACRKLYPHYVPTFREGGSSGIGGLSGKYNLAVKSTLKTAKGSTLDIMPIDVIMARQTMEVVRAGRINQLKNSLYDALESRQNYSDMRVAGVERVNKVTEKLRLTAPVKAELYNTLDVDYSTMRDMNNQISFYKDGNRITLDVTPEVFAGFEDFAPNTVYRDKLIEVVAKGNTMFKKLVTSANPFFLVRNFFRDLQDSLFYTKHGIRRFLPSLAKAYKQIATKGEMWNEYLAAGGLSSGLFDYNTGIKRDGTGLKSLAERALNKLEYANMFIEQAPRLAEYMLSRQKGLSVEQSLLDSADVTTNFGRGGKTAKMLNRTVMPFLNPSIQGWSKLVRTVFGKKNVSQWIQLIVRSLLLGIGLTALNDLLNGDDEDYKAVSLRDKENYYLFNIGDGQFLKLPKGRVLSVFGSLYLRGKESAKGNANAWDGYLESAASAVSPVNNFTRTIFSPLTDAATNTTWYGGVIEGRGLQNLSPENRYDESTSEIAKALGKALNYSPKKIHYIIDQYSGVIGDIVLPMTTAKSERGLIASNFTVNTAVSNRYSGEFYDKLDEITYAKNDGDRNAAFKYRYLNDIAGEVSDMYAKRREIENSDLSQQDKSAQSEAVSVLISQTQKSAVKGLDVLDEILNSIDYDKRVAKLTQGFAYRQLTDDEKEKAAVKMYDYYYALAMNKAFGAELDRKQTICNMINDDRIFIYLAHISSLTADTDSNGNTINGSRKKKVETYVDGLPLSSLHKYLLMLLAGYKLGDIGKNKVAGYFNEAALDNSIRENLLSFVA